MFSNFSETKSIHLSHVEIVTWKCFHFEHVENCDDDRILVLSNLKAFADDYVTLYFFKNVDNFAGKGENAGYQHFLLFPLF